MADPIIDAALTEQRDRRIIVVAAVIGIVASVIAGVLFATGSLGEWTRGASGNRNPAGLIFFVAPFAICLGIGHIVHRIVRSRRPPPPA